MKGCRIVTNCPLFFFLLVCCVKNPGGPPPVASEAWRLSDVGTRSRGDINLNIFSNGAYSATGTWFFDSYGNTVTCVIGRGSTAVVDSAVAVSAKGTASFPGMVIGGSNSSEFALRIDGIFQAGASHGTWRIDFTDSSWDWPNSSGSFDGRLQSGGGVTPP